MPKGVYDSKSRKGMFEKGHKKGMTGKRHREETIKKMGIAQKNNPYTIKKGQHFSFKTEFKKGNPKPKNAYSFKKGQKLTEETKRKQRESAFEYAKKIANIICPRVGKNEKIILDKLEGELNHKIVRQFKVCGYFLDGYISELKLAVEVDEKPKDRDKDVERENIIKKELDCNFLRIKDYD